MSIVMDLNAENIFAKVSYLTVISEYITLLLFAFNSILTNCMYV